MAIESKIEWTRSTFNPWWGCTKVSPGCDHCYAERDAHRFGTGWGVGQPRRFFGDSHWNEPRRWNEKARMEQQEDPKKQWRVFCSSMADVFDNEVAQEHRDRLWALIEETPHLTWLVLTKRIGNVSKMIPERWYAGMPRNVWLGISVVNQFEADRDIPKLLAAPAAIRFLSMEPLLGPVQLDQFHPTREPALQPLIDGIDWVIVGGESGPKARPMHPNWARSLRDQCAAAGVPFLFKQWGEWVDVDNGPTEDEAYEGKPDCWVHEDGTTHSGANGVDFFHTYPVYRVGKKAAGRLLDGVLHDGYPGVSNG